MSSAETVCVSQKVKNVMAISTAETRRTKRAAIFCPVTCNSFAAKTETNVLRNIRSVTIDRNAKMGLTKRIAVNA
jgi:hypothetical protein